VYIYIYLRGDCFVYLYLFEGDCCVYVYLRGDCCVYLCLFEGDCCNDLSNTINGSEFLSWVRASSSKQEDNLELKIYFIFSSVSLYICSLLYHNRMHLIAEVLSAHQLSFCNNIFLKYLMINSLI
jgi:hypothetical protein